MTKRFFLWSSLAFVLSVPVMAIGSALGFRGIPYTWWGFVGYNGFLLLVYITVVRHGGYSRDQLRVWFVWLLFGLWYELTVAFVIRGVSGEIVAALYVIGFSLALAGLYFARKISARPDG